MTRLAANQTLQATAAPRSSRALGGGSIAPASVVRTLPAAVAEFYRSTLTTFERVAAHSVQCMYNFCNDMKTLTSLISILAITSANALAQDPQIRADINKDIPLAEAVQRANVQFPDVQPLTEQGVVAAVKRIRAKHPDITEAVHDIYMRVIRERVLPRGMYFSRLTVMTTDSDHFDVDWKDLRLTALPAGTKDPMIGYDFNYRIRARYISSRPLTEGERKAQRDLSMRFDNALRNGGPATPSEKPDAAAGDQHR